MKKSYRRARRNNPDILDPMRSCSKYQDHTIRESLYIALTDLWPNLHAAGENLFVPREDFTVDHEFMAEWVMTFIRSGSRTMEYERVKDTPVFYPLGGFGYGLFSM
jgi:hypothetical protein